MEVPQWMLAVHDRLGQLPAGTALLVSFPVYRPDLARELGHHLGLKFYDFRADFMSARGGSAAEIPLRDMTTQLLHRAGEGPVIFHNSEALLACYPETQRREWLLDISRRDDLGGQQVVIPLYLFGSLLDHVKVDGNWLELELGDLPEQGLVSRLLNA